MGSGQDAVDVKLTRGFWLAKFELTQGEYRAVMEKNPSYFSAAGEGKNAVAGLDTDKFPVEQVSWDDAIEFCHSLTEQEQRAGRQLAGWTYTLPTEAQWEHGCRAGKQVTHGYCYDESRFEELDNNTVGGRTNEVGQNRPSLWGLHDMHGNVAEWCRDSCQAKPREGHGRERTERISLRLFCGSNWYKTYVRGAIDAGDHRAFLGFRVALVPSP